MAPRHQPSSTLRDRDQREGEGSVVHRVHRGQGRNPGAEDTKKGRRATDTSKPCGAGWGEKGGIEEESKFGSDGSSRWLHVDGPNKWVG